ncbi:ribosome biogenesis GTPase A [Clostridia bacterium]|nr:ribosome biogenesis GTPase A [Clostridia bacterium]
MMMNENIISYFPGHMAKGIKDLKKAIKSVDLIAEIIDARAPSSSKNSDFEKIILNKPKILILNKCDLANDFFTFQWLEFYNSKQNYAMKLNCKSNKNLNDFFKLVNLAMKNNQVAKNAKIMVIGIPNVGKSSFINRLIGKNRAKVENKTGVTRGVQWFSLKNGIEILDTAGILTPKFDDSETALNLSLIGSIKNEILDSEELAIKLIEKIKANYSGNIAERYAVEQKKILSLEPCEILGYIANKRNMLLRNGEIDRGRVSTMFLKEFKSGKLGKITLEMVCK